MKEEQDIIKKCGKETPFTVPEGYFEEFNRRMMEQLPLKENITEERSGELHITTWQRIKPLLYLAAMFVGMIVCVKVVLGEVTTKESNESMATNTTIYDNIIDYEQMSDEYISTLVEYTMMDSYDLYQYLTEVD